MMGAVRHNRRKGKRPAILIILKIFFPNSMQTQRKHPHQHRSTMIFMQAFSNYDSVHPPQSAMEIEKTQSNPAFYASPSSLAAVGGSPTPPHASTTQVLSKEYLEQNRPKRPLTAYNIFFKHERQRILESLPVRVKGKPRHSHGKIGFAELTRTVAARWKHVCPMDLVHFKAEAAMDKERYASEMKRWKKKKELCDDEASQSASSLESSTDDMFDATAMESTFMAPFLSQPTQICGVDDSFIPSLQAFEDMEPVPLRSTGNMDGEPLPLQDAPDAIAQLARELGSDSLDIVIKSFLWISP